MKLLANIIVIFIYFMTNAQAEDYMKAFPPAEEGMVRYVLQLPKKHDESDFQIELLVGKSVVVDKSNKYFFTGKISMETIQGWGFTRYIVKELGPIAGTLMSINPNEKRVSRFIALGGEPYLIRYNSLLPVVIYVPEGAEVRYRIWSAGPIKKILQQIEM